MIRKGYSDGPFGQLHWRIQLPQGDMTLPDLYCLHPAPFSGLAFTGIMPHLAQGRRVIAPDFPGHGGSDPHVEHPTIEQYAQAMLAVINAISGDAAVDVLGFHSGCLVAAELAASAPGSIRRLVLIDVPFFDAATRTQMLENDAAPFVPTTSLACLEQAWERGITRRVDSQGMDRSFAIFAESLRHGARMNAAFFAAFSYDCDTRFAAIACPTAVIATQSFLLDATRQAAANITGAKLIERADITRAVVDEAALPTALEVNRYLAA